MNPVLNLDAATLSPVALFLQADWVVKFVMLGLLAASIWTWALIVAFWRRLGRVRKATRNFERDFWKADDIDAFFKDQGDADLPSARVFAAGVQEWQRSTAGGSIDKGGTRERLGVAMGAAKCVEEFEGLQQVLVAPSRALRRRV